MNVKMFFVFTVGIGSAFVSDVHASDLTKCVPVAVDAAHLFQNHIVRELLVHTNNTQIVGQSELKNEENLSFYQYEIYTSNQKRTQELGTIVVSDSNCQIQSVRRHLPLLPSRQ